MAYSPEHRLLVSGGFSYDLVINNPYVSSPISRLRGHCSSIVGVEHVMGTSQVRSVGKSAECRAPLALRFIAPHTSHSNELNREVDNMFRVTHASPEWAVLYCVLCGAEKETRMSTTNKIEVEYAPTGRVCGFWAKQTLFRVRVSARQLENRGWGRGTDSSWRYTRLPFMEVYTRLRAPNHEKKTPKRKVTPKRMTESQSVQ